MKKGDISLQVIVIAILALLVLVILSVMFVTKMSDVSENVGTCAAKGGSCKVSCGDNEFRLPFETCDVDGEVCCAGNEGS